MYRQEKHLIYYLFDCECVGIIFSVVAIIVHPLLVNYDRKYLSIEATPFCKPVACVKCVLYSHNWLSWHGLSSVHCIDYQFVKLISWLHFKLALAST